MIGFVPYNFISSLPIGVKVPVHLRVAYTKRPYQGFIQAKVSFERKDVESFNRRDYTFVVHHLTFLELV